MKLTSISQTTDQVSFSWEEGGPVRIFKEGREVYSGTGTSYTDKGLEPGSMYSYVLKGNETVKLQTATAVERDEKNEDIPLQELILTTVIEKNKASVTWEPIRGVDAYDISRNGEYAGTVTEPAFQDRHINMNDSYVYEIQGIRPVELGGEEASEKSSPLAQLIDLLKVKKNEDDRLVETFIIEKDIGCPADQLSEQQPKCPVDYVLRYTTFLEDKWVENPNVLSEMRYFTGDGRSFEPDSGNYRTRAEVKVTRSKVALTRDVGASEGYTREKELVKREAASAEGIAVKDMETDERKVSFLLEHSVGNPLIPSPDIEYEMYAAFYPNGLIDISGEHDEAPHHEVYLKRGSDPGWIPLHRSETRGLDRLAPQTANRFWRYSNVV